MGDWVDIEEAIRSPGLRIVLTPGVPGPYSEAAKGILHVKKLPRATRGGWGGDVGDV